jgi:hypothetical protein
MKIRVVGYLDESVDVDKELYEAAEAAGHLTDFMHPYITQLDIELTYGKEDEFNGTSL